MSSEGLPERDGPSGAGWPGRLMIVGSVLVGLPVVLAAPLVLVRSFAGREAGHGSRVASLLTADHELASTGTYPVLVDVLDEIVWAPIRWPLLALFAVGPAVLVASAVAARGGGRRAVVGTAAGVIVLTAVAAAAILVPRLGGLTWGPAGDWSGEDPGVRINEFASSNGSSGLDEDGDASDWIELHNPTGSAVDLHGFRLSDDDVPGDDAPGDVAPGGWEFPSVSLEPGGHLVVWASGKDRSDRDGELHTDFRLDQDGEPVLFVAPDGDTVLDRAEPVFIPRDASRGRDPADAERWCWFHDSTPGEPNVPQCFDDVGLGAPQLSIGSGFMAEAFTLEVVGEGTLVYTLDGSYPDLDANPGRTLVYDGPIRIEDRTPRPERLARVDPTVPAADVDLPPPPLPAFEDPIPKATVIRVRPEFGAESVATYFVGDSVRQDDLSVISLVLDEEYLFDHDTGIYVAGRVHEQLRASDDYDPDAIDAASPANFTQTGRDWERPFADDLRRAVVLEHCTRDGICDHQRNVGIRVHGGATRTYDQKSLRLYARNDYSSRTFGYPFFADRAPVEHRRLLLRNSGNDQGRTVFLDAYMHELVAHFEADTQAYEPVIVYVNGEYWGLHNLRERFDRHYLEAVHGADPDRVIVFEGGPGRDEHGLELLEFLAEIDLSSRSVVDRVEREMVVDSFFDFLIAHVFAANVDWPGNNSRMWREPDGPDAVGDGPRDGRWRWMIFDLDQMGGGIEAYDPQTDVLRGRLAPTADPTLDWGIPFLFDRMMANDTLRTRFLVRFADHLNTSYVPERTLEVLDAVVAQIEGEMPTHYARWRDFDDVEEWYLRIDRLRDFMVARPDLQRQHLVDRFSLDGTATVQVTTDAGQGVVQVNTVRLDPIVPGVSDPEDWVGVHFLGLPVRLEATPLAGHDFVRWDGVPSGDPDSPVIEFVLQDDVEVTAVFAPS